MSADTWPIARLIAVLYASMFYTSRVDAADLHFLTESATLNANAAGYIAVLWPDFIGKPGTTSMRE